MTEDDLRQACDDARAELIRAVQQYLELDAAEDDSAGAAWSMEVAVEQVDLAARVLTEAVEALPDFEKPVGWPGREHIY